MRSSQPLLGPNSRRCREDERLLNAVLGPGKRGYIIDTRTMTLAQQAKVSKLRLMQSFIGFQNFFFLFCAHIKWIIGIQARGGGFEVEMHYPQWRRAHKPIDRRHVLLESLTKFMEGMSSAN